MVPIDVSIPSFVVLVRKHAVVLVLLLSLLLLLVVAKGSKWCWLQRMARLPHENVCGR